MIRYKLCLILAVGIVLLVVGLYYWVIEPFIGWRI